VRAVIDPAFRLHKPLAGIRVLDLTRLLPGPMATLGLADLGAEVDKLEDPAPGDYLRNMPPLTGELGHTYFALNRDKRSLVVDLKHPDGPALLLRLVTRYDVLVEGFRPGVLDRLGVGHAALLAAHPGLIVCALTGYGQDGPLARRAGHDLNYLARAGVLGVTGPADAPPMVSGAQMADVAGGAQWAIAAVLAGLLQRARTGVGCVADIAMCEGSLPLAAYALTAAMSAEPATPRGQGALDGGLAAYNTYRTLDGESVALAALEPKFWLAFAVGVGLEATLDGIVPGEHQGPLRARLAEIFAQRTRAEWAQFAATHDCCLEPVLNPTEVRDDPHHRARGVFFPVADATGAEVTCFRTPLGLGAAAEHTPARAAGTDTVAVLRDAGLDAHAIESLLASGAAVQRS